MIESASQWSKKQEARSNIKWPPKKRRRTAAKTPRASKSSYSDAGLSRTNTTPHYILLAPPTFDFWVAQTCVNPHTCRPKSIGQDSKGSIINIKEKEQGGDSLVFTKIFSFESQVKINLKKVCVYTMYTSYGLTSNKPLVKINFFVKKGRNWEKMWKKVAPK